MAYQIKEQESQAHVLVYEAIYRSDFSSSQGVHPWVIS